ncbi:MAG: hypothetical protein GY899_07385 [Verrucomicrobiaceae bacterium]|nr:hypothetical protein [Verrucomicrobiaceae bacterium]
MALMTMCVAGLLLVPAWQLRADLHRFENADGSKSFYAELLRVDNKKQLVTVRMVSGREMHFPVSILSKKDQEWVDVQKEILAAGRWLRLKLTGEWGKRTVTKAESSKTILSERLYYSELSNFGSLPLKDLEITYNIHLFRDDGKSGSRSVRTHTEKVSYLSSVPRRDGLEPVVLSQTMPLSRVSGSSAPGGG